MTTISKRPFGEIEGKAVECWTLDNGTTQVDIVSYGAAIRSICTPDKNGNLVDVALGYDTVEEYMANGGYLGAVIGRTANRIKDGKFTINGTTYALTNNEPGRNLHGGPKGFDTKVWDMEIVEEDGNQALKCSIESPHMDQGFPGNAKVSVTYRLSDDNALSLDYHGECDQDTLMALTNHAYFQLDGHDAGSIADLELKLYADFYTPVDDSMCPYGEIAPVKGTPLDFTTAKAMGKEIGEDGPFFAATGGYDHNFVLNGTRDGMGLAAEVYSPKTGIFMEVLTDLPGIQFYSGNMMPSVNGKGGCHYDKRYAFCLETQVFPNGAAIAHFPNLLLKKGECYQTKTVYRFSTKG